MNRIPNMNKMEQMEGKLFEEFDLSSRLSRYESMTPELIEMAHKEGLTDKKAATLALFISDFIVTSSEVPVGTDDETRRKSIINSFIIGLKERNVDSEKITRIFYLAYNLAVQLRRSDAFLSGRGVKKHTRAMILVYTFVLPFLERSQKVLGEDNCNYELGLLSAALSMKYPDQEISQIPRVKIGENALLNNLYRIIIDFVDAHNQETNENVVLSNVLETKIIYINSIKSLPLISTYNCDKLSSKSSLKQISQMVKFFKNSDKDNRLVFLKGRIHGENTNLILARNPDIEGQPFVIMQSPADEINVSEMMMLLSAHNQIRSDWKDIVNTVPIEESYVEETQRKEDKWIEEPASIETSDKSDKVIRKTSLFGKIKGIFGGGGSKKTSDQVVKTKSVRKKVSRTVTKKEEKFNTLGLELPHFISESLAVLALADLRLFEEFDTIRESEYVISGAMESDFEKNTTTFLTTRDMDDPKALATTLDGLDDVIEKVTSYYFGSSIQILPTEIVFVSDDQRRYIICLDGNLDRLVGTIGKTYVKDQNNWQEKLQSERLQRRSLHMRTGQLLSARQHTPFDIATERIYSLTPGEDPIVIKLDHAVLPYSRARID